MSVEVKRRGYLTVDWQDNWLPRGYNSEFAAATATANTGWRGGVDINFSSAAKGGGATDYRVSYEKHELHYLISPLLEADPQQMCRAVITEKPQVLIDELVNRTDLFELIVNSMMKRAPSKMFYILSRLFFHISKPTIEEKTIEQKATDAATKLRDSILKDPKSQPTGSK